MRQPKLNPWGCAAALVLGLLPLLGTARAQDAGAAMSTPADAAAATTEMEEAPPTDSGGRHYNIRMGAGGLNFSAGLQLRYVDNVFLSNTGRRDDFVVSPEAILAAFYPIGLSNALTLDVGVTYYQYTKNTELNTGTPIISPNSALAFTVQSGDFTFQPSEAFSYQENPIYETGGQFFNVENTGRLARFNNQVGLGVKWDLNQLVATAAYYHQNLWANGSEFNYINHASELLNADVMLAVSPTLSAGVETWGSFNTFDNRPILDSWRVWAGPGLRWNPTPFLRARLGGGYERIDFNSGTANAEGVEPLNTFYFYARVEHNLNQFLVHALEGSHDNQIGYNGGNLAGYHIIYNLTWKPREQLTLSPLAAVHFYHEGFGSGSPTLYNERFTYASAGLTAVYQLGEHWRTTLSWGYNLKSSGVSGLGYSQNQAAVELLYAF